MASGIVASVNEYVAAVKYRRAAEAAQPERAGKAAAAAA
jgi:hypothetical protein